MHILQSHSLCKNILVYLSIDLILKSTEIKKKTNFEEEPCHVESVFTSGYPGGYFSRRRPLW